MSQQITSRQRAYLRALANPVPTIFQIGKAGITEELAKQVSEALEARELVKLRVLENALLTAREAADELAPMVDAVQVQCIGNRFTLYRKSNTMPAEKRIVLPK